MVKPPQVKFASIGNADLKGEGIDSSSRSI